MDNLEAIEKIRIDTSEILIPFGPKDQYIIIGNTIATLMAVKTLLEAQIGDPLFVKNAQERSSLWGKEIYILLQEQIKDGA